MDANSVVKLEIMKPAKPLDKMNADELGRLFPVELVRHDPGWRLKYLSEKELLESSLGERCIVRISHIGSTAIPGIHAKPIVDILLEIINSADIAGLKSVMKSVGYKIASPLSSSKSFCGDIAHFAGSDAAKASAAERERNINSRPDNPPPHLTFVKGYTQHGFEGQAFHVHIRYGGEARHDEKKRGKALRGTAVKGGEPRRETEWDEIIFRDYLISHPQKAIEYEALKLGLLDEFEFDRDGYTEAKGGFVAEVMELAKAEREAKKGRGNRERKK